MRLSPYLFSSGMTFLSLCSAAAQVETHKTPIKAQPAFSLTISVAKDTIKAGMPIRVHIILKNTSKHNIVNYHDRYAVLEGFKARVHDASGKVAPTTQLGTLLYGTRPKGTLPAAETVGNPIRGTLLPGQSSEHSMDISDLYILDKPGKYTIQVTNGDVKSNTITVTVTK